MSEPDPEADGSTAAERVPIPMPAELADRDRMPPLAEVETNTVAVRPLNARHRGRDSKVPPPRRWRKVRTIDLRECPLCHCVVAGIQSGGWHLKLDHGEGENHLDLDDWEDDLHDEIRQYREARATAPGWRESPTSSNYTGGRQAALILAGGVLVVVAVVIYVLVTAAGH